VLLSFGFFFFSDKPKAPTFLANFSVFRVVQQFAVAIAFEAEKHAVFFWIKIIVHVSSGVSFQFMSWLNTTERQITYSFFLLLVFLSLSGLVIAYFRGLNDQRLLRNRYISIRRNVPEDHKIFPGS